MKEIFSRAGILLGEEALERLAGCHVALFGVGGVGGHCGEALARSGVGRFTLIDGDRVVPSNINRQAVALHSTVGLYKADVMRDRIVDINPEAVVASIPRFYAPGDDDMLQGGYDLVIDAIDDIPAKADIAARAEELGIPCLSCMGAGNKTGPARFMAADLYETSMCPLARAMRKAARDLGVSRLRVLYTQEAPAPQRRPQTDADTGRPVPGSVVFVTGAAGLALAGEAVRMLLSSDR